MSLQVIVINATNVPNPETFGECDPIASVTFQGQKKKTKVIKSDINPTWNETLEFDLQGVAAKSSDEIVIEIKDWERVGRNRLLGTHKFKLNELTRGGTQSKSSTENLLDANGRPHQAQIKFKITYNPPPGASNESSGGGGGGGGQIVEQPDDEDDEEDEELEGDEVDGGGAAGEAGGGASKPKRKKKASRRRRKKLSSKPQDFQIRIKVLEARQLQGANIQPVTRVSCLNQMKQTRIKKSTNSPVFNESFFFNYKMSPAELFDEIIEFKVFNSKKLRSDALIGSFKCDVGLVYDEPQHALLNKWLLLSDPDDTMSGAKGYLKISAVVIGPGDSAPSMKATSQNDSEDIESNLLRPAGVQLRPATFMLRLYRAEDIPRMDSAFMEGVKKIFGAGNDQKEFVDPYFMFSFAGKELKSKTIYSCDHPEWNQELSLGLQFPSMCERIKFMIKDWDRVNADDTTGSAYLELPTISAFGPNGYLPTFGPCYVNFYGSTREYSDLPDEYDDLNLGKGEGLAYRGRALVELVTTLGEVPEVAINDIHQDDLLRVQKFMRRRKYKLHAAFLNATMVNEIDAPVEFEVSIGNYGNKLDEAVAPCASSTQPTNAVFDGSCYYFLPWSATKPCVVVDSSWEDISFRLEALNLILRIIDALEANMERVQIGIKAKLPIPEVAQLLISLLDQLVLDCRKQLPVAVPGQHQTNELDKLTALYRRTELDGIGQQASKLRENATDITEAMSEIENFLAMLKNLAIEPQNSMPDVSIWMISGDKRIAYYRIPANEVLYSQNPNTIGRQCGKLQTIQLKYPGLNIEKDKKWEVPGLVQVRIWLGLNNQENEWHNMQKEGELAVFAETYENMVSILGTWTTKGPTMSRPKFSDSQGKVSLKKEKFVPPPGWRWDSEWYVSPELSMLFEKDAGHKKFIEDIYECHSRGIPGGTWQAASRPWSDVKGDECPARDEIVLGEGWSWDNDWQVDLSRAVDEEGFEYCVEATIGGYGPVEKTYHLCRRRRWLRSRTLKMDVKKQEEQEKQLVEAADGWEYAPLFNMKFHAIERTMDLVRRRRWHRKMVADNPSASCFFSMAGDDDDDEENDALTAPRMFLTFQKSYKYQLRVYIYQARGLLAADDSGLSDPFIQVSFLTRSMKTETVHKSLCPTWDQTLIIDDIEIYGNPKSIESQPPDIFLELFDHDTFGKPEFLGRTKAQPMVKLDPADARTPVLQWYDIIRFNQEGGELLGAFELFLMTGKDLPFLPPKKGNLFLVPNGIRPIMQRTGVEVVCWGLRNMKKFQLGNVSSPCIEFECGGNVLQSSVIKDTKKNPNFDEPLLFFDVMLPKDELYMPPVNIKVRDHRQFGRKPTVGIFVLKSLEEFRIEPIFENDDEDQGGIVGNGEHVIDMPVEEKPKKVEEEDEDIDWWSKYYASIGETGKCKKYMQKGYDKIKFYKKELEKEEQFTDFHDFCNTFGLRRGKEDDDDDSNVVGEFKGTFRVYPLPQDPAEPLPQKALSILPSSTPEECIVRCYIIKATDLQPNDSSGLADPFLEIEIGKEKKNTRDDYIPNSLDPVFGLMFEMKATIPLAKDLIVRVKDYDLISADDIIGETVIDLENRYLSKHMAMVGLPSSYCISGVNQWRDSRKPKTLLEVNCQKNHLSVPMFYGNNSVKVGKTVYNLGTFEQGVQPNPHWGPPEERLALHVLHTFPLVKEHVETRALFNPLQPGIEQGKVQMFVDIFPKSLGEPGPPFDIKPRKPKGHVLRVVIWNTVDVVLEEESIIGDKMSDIYVVGWMSGIDERQKTDVHYRSLDGEGNFNWRFVFPFDYIPAEQAMTVKKKEHFWSLDETEQHLPPILMTQIWDNDKFSADDFLGTLQLNLHSMPLPAKKPRGCNLSMLPDINNPKEIKTVSLFDVKRLRGFWPCYSDETGEKLLTGKVEMELELIPATEAEERPAGTGQDEPNMHPKLDPPKRPETSFLWFASPWKTFKFIIWRRYKWWFIGGLILLLLIALIVIFLYSFPGSVSDWIVNG